jgi:hypothetical protein
MEVTDRRTISRALEQVCSLLMQLDDASGTVAERVRELQMIHAATVALITRTNAVTARVGLAPTAPPALDCEASHPTIRARLREFLLRRREEFDALVA